MSRVRVKICGLTRIEDVQAAVAAGADAVGFVFTSSLRRISAEKARELSAFVPDGVKRVGLFLDQEKKEIDQVVNTVALDILQFHGQESEQQCRVFGLPYLKAVAMQNSRSVEQAEMDYPTACGLLLDSHIAGQPGGSGKAFDWDLLIPSASHLWLAGGLNPENVGLAIKLVRPYAVDVSSGVEVSPGIKDPARMTAFIRAVREQEDELESNDK